ncbi:mediator of RNA polymerase II transcription subunit 27 isoform X3 [Trachypithecus francoisi]|uniref:mediator of RNA polymerase II transcription subunit 27 isoform X3 n=1 Tax=Trachypithecus francoisi TaxID=54180 RepID=UPI00141AF0D5|nr:mediator of RNA polymerase II transcription subunit 27 isoform X3 [Trachypithecus francoisi]
MADVINVSVNLEAFSQAISAIQALRSSVSRVFDCLKDGMRNKETLEGREKAFIAHFQDNLHSVNRDLNELERLSNLVGKPSENHPLHNSGLLSLDPVQDKTPLYSQLLQAYKWSNKLQYHAGLASGLLNQQSLKRSANQMGVSAKRRPKAQPTTLVLPPQYVDDVINRIDRMFPEMSIHLSRPNGTSAMLLLDIWSKSNYQVFQKKACLCPACFLYAGWEWPLTRLCPALSGNRPRHHCPAPLSAAPDAGRRGPILHDLVKKLHKAVPGPVPALREVSAGRPSPDVEGFPNPRSLP